MSASYCKTEEPSPCGWVLMRDPYEVMPCNDIGVHISGADCSCRPEINDDDIIVHNAFDRREDFIEGRRQPS